ncbi:MAG: efflux RND transporter periplasmic adaptor subunit [Leptospiraceae bacterium]|nr:efflux RND transporter periplasmic adaptor subunit [Leptospiraceae bacterium]MCK6380421.1 efflux RND transporter periplasmic adaptor subunit [Leptospiraceae bacterium]NUM41183.1 efflux RND transporter periplasmic adaptor subunit [Leptospiraceae bacterium]
MKTGKYIIIAILAVTFLVLGYGKLKEKKAIPEGKNPTEDSTTSNKENSNRIDLSMKIKVPSEIKEDTEIETIEVKRKDFQDTISVIGEISANPDNIRKIGARLAGRITSVNFKEGDHVKKGDTLITLDSPDASRLRSKFLGSLSRYTASQKNYSRLKELVTLRLAGEQEAINAESELRIMESELEADRENLRVYDIAIPNMAKEKKETIGNYEVRSPKSGIILSREAIVGGQVDANTNMGTVGDISEVWFIGKLFEKDISKIGTGENAIIQLNAYPNTKFEGRLTYIGIQIDPSSRTVNARIVLKNKKNLAKVGLFGVAEISAIEPEVISVPSYCLTEVNGKVGVFVEEKPGEYVFREVAIGRKSNTLVEIVSGISEREFVVRKGIFFLKSILLKSTFGAED